MPEIEVAAPRRRAHRSIAIPRFCFFCIVEHPVGGEVDVFAIFRGTEHSLHFGAVAGRVRRQVFELARFGAIAVEVVAGVGRRFAIVRPKEVFGVDGEAIGLAAELDEFFFPAGGFQFEIGSTNRFFALGGPVDVKTIRS